MFYFIFTFIIFVVSTVGIKNILWTTQIAHLNKLDVNHRGRVQIHETVSPVLGCVPWCAASSITTKVQLLVSPLFQQSCLFAPPDRKEAGQQVASLQPHVCPWTNACHSHGWQHVQGLAWKWREIGKWKVELYILLLILSSYSNMEFCLCKWSQNKIGIRVITWKTPSIQYGCWHVKVAHRHLAVHWLAAPNSRMTWCTPAHQRDHWAYHSFDSDFAGPEANCADSHQQAKLGLIHNETALLVHIWLNAKLDVPGQIQ